MSQNGQIHFKNLAAFAERFLKCVWTFWDTMHERIDPGWRLKFVVSEQNEVLKWEVNKGTSRTLLIKLKNWRWQPQAQSAYTCSKLTIEILEHGVKYVKS